MLRDNFPVDRTTEQKIVAELCVGDYVLVRPGEIVPADGRVVEGVSCANEALLTGESLLMKIHTNRIVNFVGNPRLINRFVDVRITASLAHTLKGEIVIREN